MAKGPQYMKWLRGNIGKYKGDILGDAQHPTFF